MFRLNHAVCTARKSSPIPLLNSTRLLSSSVIRNQQASATATKPKPKEKKQSPDVEQSQAFSPRFIGLTRDIYIPVSLENYPNFFTSPRMFLNCALRRLYNFGINTIQIALFRYQTGLKVHFLLWKNKSIEKYIQVNKAFATKKIDTVEKSVTIWVDSALKARLKTIPKSVKLDWNLIKFNKIPQLIAFRPVMLPGKPVEYVQLVYKFNTKQELIKVNATNESSAKLTRDVVDYVGFVVDLDTNEVILSGSVFENQPADKIPKPTDVDNSKIFEDMKINGDIFRPSPKQLLESQNAAEQTKTK